MHSALDSQSLCLSSTPTEVGSFSFPPGLSTSLPSSCYLAVVRYNVSCMSAGTLLAKISFYSKYPFFVPKILVL